MEVIAKRQPPVFILISLAALLVPVFGCEANRPLGPSVSGMISVADSRDPSGTPLPDGLITWEPINQTKGPKISARILQGRYAIDSEAGLNPGEYRIEIMTMPAEIAAALEGSSQPPGAEPQLEIDARFNQRSILKFRLDAAADHRFDAQVKYRKPSFN